MNDQQKAAFELGVIRSAINLQHNFCQPDMAAQLLIDGGCSKFNARNFCEYDKIALRAINDNERINIRGLR